MLPANWHRQFLARDARGPERETICHGSRLVSSARCRGPVRRKYLPDPTDCLQAWWELSRAERPECRPLPAPATTRRKLDDRSAYARIRLARGRDGDRVRLLILLP